VSNLALIQPQRQDFDTQQTCDWLDPLPILGTASAGGVVAGAANTGNGSLTLNSVAPGTPFGAYVATVTQAGALARYAVTDTNGLPLAQGVTGAPLYAGGLTLTLSQGSTLFAVGDTFAVSVLPAPIDLTGLRFDLDSRIEQGSPSIALQASTADAYTLVVNGVAQTVTSIVNGGVSGVISMQVPRARMAACAVSSQTGFPYSILATDPASGLTVPAFYGLIHHTAVAAQIGS
jgi:hypothetical protein